MRKYLREVKLEVKQSPEYRQLINEIKACGADIKARKLATAKLRALKKKFKRKHRAKKRARVKVRPKKNLIEYRALLLEENLPASERWFRDLYLKENIQRQFSEDLFKDQFNKPFNKRYIPDICNVGYKYIIEVDGSYHNRPDQQLKDIRKDYYFHKRGYLVIRVKYGDNAGYKACIEKIRERIAEIDALETSRRNELTQ